MSEPGAASCLPAAWAPSSVLVVGCVRGQIACVWIDVLIAWWVGALIHGVGCSAGMCTSANGWTICRMASARSPTRVVHGECCCRLPPMAGHGIVPVESSSPHHTSDARPDMRTAKICANDATATGCRACAWVHCFLKSGVAGMQESFRRATSMAKASSCTPMARPTRANGWRMRGTDKVTIDRPHHPVTPAHHRIRRQHDCVERQASTARFSTVSFVRLR